MFLYLVDVGWTSVRPVRPDQHVHSVRLWAENDNAAHLAAAQWLASRPSCQMVTSTAIREVEL